MTTQAQKAVITALVEYRAAQTEFQMAEYNWRNIERLANAGAAREKAWLAYLDAADAMDSSKSE